MKTVNLKFVCYIMMIMFLFQLANYNIDIANSGEPQSKPAIKKMPTSEIFKKLGTILSDRNVIIEVHDYGTVILNQLNKKYFITKIKKIPLMKEVEVFFGPNIGYDPPCESPDLVVNIYKKNNKDELMIQILCFSGSITAKEPEKNAHILFSAIYTDIKQIPDFFLSIWGKDAHNFVSELRAIYNKQQATTSKRR